MFLLSQFFGADYLGAWNRLSQGMENGLIGSVMNGSRRGVRGVLLYYIQQGLMNLDEHDGSFLKVFTLATSGS